MKTLTAKQNELIKDNLRAYINNFGYIMIEKADYGSGFYVYTDEQRAAEGSYTQFCYNIDYLNGWLYGAVQAANGVMKPINKEGKCDALISDLFYIVKSFGHSMEKDDFYNFMVADIV